MSMNPLNDISSVYMQEVLKPQLGKKEGGDSPAGGTKVKKGENTQEASAKRIRQAVYDIRYRARREDVPLEQAFNQYSGKSGMTGPEKAAVKEKLGLAAGSSAAPVKEAVDAKKFMVRVTDKTSGKTYRRYATREKISQLRANPNISSVEITEYGNPYEGEKKKGEQTSKVKSGKGLDPVGREDSDIDNDGDHDKTDKYLLNRRKVRGAAIAKKKSVKEGFSNWRSDLYEVMDDVEAQKEIKEKKVKNKIKINPEMKEAVESLGGQLVEMVEFEEDVNFDNVLEELTDEELILLSDELIDEAVEEFFIEANNEGYDLDEVESILIESLDSSLEVISEVNQYFAAMHKAQNKKRQSERRAEKIQKVKDTVKKVGERVKSAVKSAADKAKKTGKATVKSVATAAGSAAGKAVSTAKKVGAAAKAGYDAATSDSEEEKSPKTYRIKYRSAKKMEKRPGLLSKVGSKLKSGLKKAVGRGARAVAKGADKLASKLGESTHDKEMRKLAAQERASERKERGGAAAKLPGRLGKSAGTSYADYQQVSIAAHDKATKKNKNVVGLVTKEETEIEEGMTMKDFKKQRSRQKQKEKRASDKIAPNRRKNIHTDRYSPERAARHRANVDPDFEGNDERNYPGGKLKNAKKIRKAKALGELGEQTEIQEKALSRAQQRFMGMVYAAKKGETPASPEVAKAAAGISKKSARDFAKTKHAKLPEKKVEEAVTQIGGRETTPPSGTTAKQDDVQRKQMLANKQKMVQKQQMLQRQELQLQKQGKMPVGAFEEVEIVSELNRYEKETGKDYATGKPVQKGGAKDDKAYTQVKKMIRRMEGKPKGQQKKVPGKKPPVAGRYGAPESPAQKVAKRRAAAQRAQDSMSSRFD